MVFAIVTLLLWGIYAFLLKRHFGKEFMPSKSLIPLILICIISTICLGVNFVVSTIPNINDGIAIDNFLAYWIIGEGNWSVQLFKEFFNSSVYICLFLTFVYSVLSFAKK